MESRTAPPKQFRDLPGNGRRRMTLPDQTVSEAEKRGPRRTLPTSPHVAPEKRDGRRTKPKLRKE